MGNFCGLNETLCSPRRDVQENLLDQKVHARVEETMEINNDEKMKTKVELELEVRAEIETKLKKEWREAAKQTENEQCQWWTIFMLSYTAFFAICAYFAHITHLYQSKPQPVSFGEHLSGYMISLLLANFAYKVANVTMIKDLPLGWVISGAVGLGWSLVQEQAGTNITLTASSIKNDWTPQIFLCFGVAAFFIVAVMLARIWELCKSCQGQQQGEENSKNEEDEDGTQCCSDRLPQMVIIFGVIVFFVLGFKLGHPHCHHWFTGLVLALVMTGTEYKVCQIFRDFCFGLFLHGSAAWGPSGLFQ